MDWLRSNRRCWGSLALAAFALQIVISLGHVHVAAPTAMLVAVNVDDSSSQPSPAQPAKNENGYCAICAAIHLTGHAFVPPAPQLPVPSAWQPLEHLDRLAVILTAPRRTPFQSRAPPSA